MQSLEGIFKGSTSDAQNKVVAQKRQGFKPGKDLASRQQKLAALGGAQPQQQAVVCRLVEQQKPGNRKQRQKRPQQQRDSGSVGVAVRGIWSRAEGAPQDQQLPQYADQNPGA